MILAPKGHKGAVRARQKGPSPLKRARGPCGPSVAGKATLVGGLVGALAMAKTHARRVAGAGPPPDGAPIPAGRTTACVAGADTERSVALTTETLFTRPIRADARAKGILLARAGAGPKTALTRRHRAVVAKTKGRKPSFAGPPCAVPPPTGHPLSGRGRLIHAASTPRGGPADPVRDRPTPRRAEPAKTLITRAPPARAERRGGAAAGITIATPVAVGRRLLGKGVLPRPGVAPPLAPA